MTPQSVVFFVIGHVPMEHLDVFVTGHALKANFLLRFNQWDVKHLEQLGEERGDFVLDCPVIPQVLVIGNSDQEFKELCELHIVVLSSIHRLINDCHLRQIEKHLDGALRQ